MTTVGIAVRGEAYTFTVGLSQQADVRLLQDNPALEAGDVTVSVDGGAFAPVGTLPSVEPAGGPVVRVSLSAAEMDGDEVVVLFHDVAGAEWSDKLVSLRTGSAWDVLVSALTTPSSIGHWLVSKLGLLSGAGSVSVTSPVSGWAVSTIQGDDYHADDGRAIEWVIDAPGLLSGGGLIAVTLAEFCTYAGEIVGADTVRLELDGDQTAGISAGTHLYDVVLTQPDGDRITLVRGEWRSRRAYAWDA